MTTHGRTGVAVPLSGPWATPANQVRVATRAEELGYDSLWTFSRLLFPTESSDPSWRDSFGSTFRETGDPLVTLAFLAAHTRRVRLGVSALIVPFYAPAVLAKQLIALDRVSGGRLDAGMAQGWSPDEFVAAGVPFDRRLGRTLEHIEVMRRMWEQEVAGFDGEFSTLPTGIVRPRPVQPTFPVLLGGSGDQAWRRAGRLGLGWVGPSFASREEITRAVAMVREGAEKAGKNPDDARIVVRGSSFVRPAAARDRELFHGSLEQIAGDAAEMLALGATEVFVDFNFDIQVVGPDVDPARSMDLMEQALEVLAPATAVVAA